MSDIFLALSAVQKSLAASGIAKEQTNKFDKYKFRGIDDVYNHLAKTLSECGVVIVPTVEQHDITPMQTAKGGSSIMARVRVVYTMYAVEDGTSVSCTVVGEGMDRGDKAINKAMSAAYKLMAFQTFCIPVEGHSVDSEQESLVAGPQLISPDQVQQVENLIGKINMDMQKFLSWAKLDSVADMQAEHFDGFMDKLKKRESQVAAEYAAEAAAEGNSMEVPQ